MYTIGQNNCLELSDFTEISNLEFRHVYLTHIKMVSKSNNEKLVNNMILYIE